MLPPDGDYPEGSSGVPEVDSSCRLLIVPLFRGSSRFEGLILSHHSRYKVTCECNEEGINDDDDDDGLAGLRPHTGQVRHSREGALALDLREARPSG